MHKNFFFQPENKNLPAVFLHIFQGFTANTVACQLYLLLFCARLLELPPENKEKHLQDVILSVNFTERNS